MFDEGDPFTTTGIACDPTRLNYRYQVMFEPVKQMFQGSTVLDLGCHNGRWSYVSLQLGASKVVGIERDPKMLELGKKILHDRQVAASLFSFTCANVEKVALEGFTQDVQIVLCMGLLYYLTDPLGLLERIAAARPSLCIVDTFHSWNNVPDKRELDLFLRSIFLVKQLACYDRGRRIAYHCRPQIKLL